MDAFPMTGMQSYPCSPDLLPYGPKNPFGANYGMSMAAYPYYPSMSFINPTNYNFLGTSSTSTASPGSNFHQPIMPASQLLGDASSGYSSGNSRFEAITPDLESLSSTSDDLPDPSSFNMSHNFDASNLPSTSSDSLSGTGDSAGNSNSSSPTLQTNSASGRRSAADCAVCGDKASGLHYGIHSCEGCKGFFRRSVQKNLTYKCHKNGHCLVNRATRNRCQACRFHRCMDTGMSKDAVRGEKQRKSKTKKEEPLDSILPTLSPNLRYIVDQIVFAHETTSLPQQSLRDNNSGIVTNPFTDISELSVSAAAQVMDFVKRLPGFHGVPPIDRQILLKSGCLEIMLLRMCYNYDLYSRRFVLSGGIYLTDQLCKQIGLGDMMEDLVHFAKMLANMRMDRTLIALLSAVCFFCADRPGLHTAEMIRMSQNPVSEALKILMIRHQPTRPYNFTHLLMQLVKLRTVAAKCGEKIRNGQFLLVPKILMEIVAPEMAPPAYSIPSVPSQQSHAPVAPSFTPYSYASQTFNYGTAMLYHGSQ